MPRRKRTILLAALALAVPLPAFALPGEVGTEAEPAVTDLAVSASLDGCGLLDTQIVCTLSVSYATLPNATGYTASVTSPDGSVTDAGAVPAGGTSIVVPYAGNGTYSVRVTAYGIPEDDPEAEEQVIATEVTGNLNEAGPGDARVTEGPVKSDAITRNPPGSDQADGQRQVQSETTCAAQPPAPAPTPDPAAETTTPEVESTVTPEAGSTPPDETAPPVGRQTADAQTADQADQDAAAPAPAPSGCPAA